MKSVSRVIAASIVAAVTLIGPTLGHAQTIRIANQGDALSLDPHSLNESMQLGLLANVYEPLVGRNKDLSAAPLLATRWKQASPTVWRFELRKDVTFHDGTPFTADDVVFSLARAAGEGSDMKSDTAHIREVRRIGDHVVDIETRGPFLLLPEALTQLMIMSRKWSEENRAGVPANPHSGIGSAVPLSIANGTGPYRIRERRGNVGTSFVRNATYWGKIDGNAQEIVFTPIPDPVARVAALISGEVDVMEPVPVQDIEHVNASATARVVSGPELRTVFLGVDQARDELLYADVKGKNPFKDKRVRQAFYQAIDISDIQRTVMRGASHPTALLIGPGINGWTQAQDKRMPYDPAAAKKLLAEAGYPEGFGITLNCPGDRYVNDAQVCENVAAGLKKVGVRVTVAIEPKASYFPKILKRDTSFYLLGWTPATYDAQDALAALTECPGERGEGRFNLGGYCNPKLDDITRRLRSEADKTRRAALVDEAFMVHGDDIGTLPLHQQSLAWGVSKKVELTQMPDNAMPFKWMSIRR